MFRMFFLWLSLSTFLSNISFAQDYTAVDAHARSVTSTDDLTAVAQALVAPFDSEREQVRAIFTWVTHHVRYDCNEFKRAPQDRRARTKEQILDRAFRRGMGVCAGYAALFEALCEAVHIEAEVVSGYARKSSRTPNPARLPSSHAWNAVRIDGEWQLVDPTWGAGYVTGDCDRYRADFYDFYFLPTAEQMLWRHFPDDPKWQLLAEPVSAEAFVAQPYIARLPKTAELLSLSPALGKLDSDQADYTFRLQLRGARKLALRTGAKIYPMEAGEEGTYTYTLKRSAIRGRTVEILFFETDTRYKPIIFYER